MMKKRIGFAGVGRMGTPMARRLLDAGYETSVCDVNKDAVASLEKAGSRVAATPAALMGMADMVLMSLPTPEIVQAVALGEEGLVKGEGARIVIDLSTTGPRVMRVAAGLQAAGITPVDCPVSGGVGGAEKGTLAIMVACASAALPEVLPVLEVLGKPTHIGEEPWMGQMLKVINNIISVTSLAIASEALVLGAKAGLDPKVMMDVINAGTGRTNATTDNSEIRPHPQLRFWLRHWPLAKDLRLCLEESDAFGVPMVVGSAVRQLVNITKGRLGPDADLTEIIRPIEEWAGVEVTGKKPP